MAQPRLWITEAPLAGQGTNPATVVPPLLMGIIYTVLPNLARVYHA